MQKRPNHSKLRHRKLLVLAAGAALYFTASIDPFMCPRPRTNHVSTHHALALSSRSRGINSSPPPTLSSTSAQPTRLHFLSASVSPQDRRNLQQEQGRSQMAAKVHPNVAAVPEPPCISTYQQQDDQPPVVLTVWRKSLLFNCHGFTVFDAKGNLAFRLDCYDASSTRRRSDLVLMDAAGKPLLTIRRKRLSLSNSWIIYDGDGAATATSLLSVRRRRVGLRASKAIAHVTPLSSSLPLPEPYVVEGSYGRRSCAVRDARGDAVAEVRRKESVGDDVFRLVAEPRLGAPLAMGIVIAIDEMFRGGSRLRRTCSA